MLKRQQFKENGSNETEPKGSKRQRLDERDNEKGNSLDKDEGEIEGTRYVFPPFDPLFPLSQKVSNRLSDLGKGTRSPNNFVCIPKIYYLRSANFVLEFPGRGGLKVQKKIYISLLREGLESHSASTASTASGITNYRRPITKRLESHFPSNHHQDLGTQLCANHWQGFGSDSTATTSSLFTNTSNLPKVTPSPTKAPATGHSLWRRYCRPLEIKDSTFAGRSLCKYT